MPVQNATNSAVAAEPAREVVLTRLFDAPRDVVFKAWTDPKQMAAWWGPHGFTSPIVELDPRPGGAIRIDMRGPDGVVYPMTGTFREIVKPERIVMICYAFDGKLEVRNDVTFADENGKTKITLKATVIQSTPDTTDAVAGMPEGWTQSLERLSEFVSPTADREIAATRVFDAPREIVWKMWTERDHIAKWWGPKGFTNTIHTMDVSPGGTWEFIMHGPDGRDYSNKIIYREVVKPERIVYDHISGPLFHAVVTFTAEGNKTKINMRMLFESAALRDRTAKEFGAVEGLNQTLGRLEEELAKMSDQDFIISRTFDAPRDLMWKAWTEPERMAQWFGPKGVKIFHSKNDMRPGGIYHYGMRTPDGKDIWGKWTYREVSKPQRLVFVNSFSDEKGGVTRHPLSKDWPLEMLTTIEFAEDKGKTTVTVRWSPINANEAERNTFNSSRDSMKQGWTGTFEQLDAYLAKAKTS